MMKMKHRYLALCWSALCLAAAAPAVLAQDYTPVPVTISRSQISMSGRQYYVHIVLERQTIYGITKAYNVTEEDLYAANPMLKEEGLRSGTVIYIPVVSGEHKERTAAVKEHSSAQAKEKAAQAKEVKEKPAAKEKEKTAVKEKPAREKPAPKEKPAKESSKKIPAPKEGYVQHTVKWFENIYDVAAAYGVTPQQIMDANGLKSSAISKRQVLLIPVGETAKSTSQATVPSVTTTLVPEEAEKVHTAVTAPSVTEEKPVVAAEEKADDDEPGIMDFPVAKGTAEIALVMPFNANGKYSESNMDFYSGVLMALRDLEKEGVKTTLNVFDLQAGTPSAYQLNRNEVILGPITTADLTKILEITDGRVPVISPLDQRAAGLADTHEGFVQAPSSTASQYAELARWAAEDRAREDRIILVSEITSEGSTAAATGIRNALRSAGASFEEASWTVGQGRSLPGALTSRLTKGGVNRIVVASEKEAFIGDIVRNLGILINQGYKIAMYAPSRVRTFETVDGSLYHQDDLHICSPYHADYDSEEVKAFVRAYRALYRTDPSQFAFQGYDLTRYFARMCAKYGNRWFRAIDREPGSGLHTDFRFEKVRNGSYRNTGIRRIRYNTDYSTTLVR